MGLWVVATFQILHCTYMNRLNMHADTTVGVHASCCYH